MVLALPSEGPVRPQVKGAWLAERVRRGEAPRCELEQIVEGYDRGSAALARAGWRDAVPWPRLLAA